MATAKEEIERSVKGEGCLGRSAPDEPVFVLVARDLLAARTVREWADDLENRAARSGDLTDERKQKIADARRTALAMDRWHEKKLPD